MALIKCENVSIGYEGQTVVKDLNFTIEHGDYLCIVGENGSGKSTLVKSLLGLKSVERGKIIYGDGLKQTQIGYLPQQTDVQKDFPASVGEVVPVRQAEQPRDASVLYGGRPERSCGEDGDAGIQTWRNSVSGICPEDRSREFSLRGAVRHEEHASS